MKDLRDELRQRAVEYVDLVRVDRSGKEHRESMPRNLAELAIARIPLDEPEIATAKIETIKVQPKAEYQRQAQSEERKQANALAMANRLPARSA